MLDKRTEALLEAINFECKTGSYQIVEQGELLDYFPDCYAVDGDGLAQMLAFLREHEYIDIKYAEGGTYCLCPLPQGRLYFERTRESSQKEGELTKRVLFFCGVGAFLGAVLGGAIAALLL